MEIATKVIDKICLWYYSIEYPHNALFVVCMALFNREGQECACRKRLKNESIFMHSHDKHDLHDLNFTGDCNVMKLNNQEHGNKSIALAEAYAKACV